MDAQTPVQNVCNTLKAYLKSGIFISNLTDAQNIKGEGEYDIMTKSVTVTPVTLGIQRKWTPPFETNFELETTVAKEREDYCTIMCVFFEIDPIPANVAMLKTALDNETLVSAPTMVTIGTKNLTITRLIIGTGAAKVNKAMAVLFEPTTKTAYHKRCRLPALKKRVDSRINKRPYRMNLEIKDGNRSAPYYQDWALWDADWEELDSVHKKYLNIHFDLNVK